MPQLKTGFVVTVGGKTEHLEFGGEVGRGGEGVIYDIKQQPKSVVKLYLKPRDANHAAKLGAMVAMANDQLFSLGAWPRVVLLDQNGMAHGFMMAKIWGHRPIFHVYGPNLRLKEFPTADWRFLIHVATNIARAFACLHQSDVVIGDVNHGNLMISTDGTCQFIDCDSFQITQGDKCWFCEVGTSTHQPPEMQGLTSYKNVLRTANHDNFGLAVLIYQLLCAGQHPFSGMHSGSGEAPSIEQSIKDCAYKTLVPPPSRLPKYALPTEINQMFRAAFDAIGINDGRPTGEQWVAALSRLSQQVRQCDDVVSHYYYEAMSNCPWCAIETKIGARLFPGTLIPNGNDNLLVLWQQVEALVSRPKPTMPVMKSTLNIAPAYRFGALFAVFGIIAALIGNTAAPSSLVPEAIWFLASTIGFAVFYGRYPRSLRDAKRLVLVEKNTLDKIDAKWDALAAKFQAIKQSALVIKASYDNICSDVSSNDLKQHLQSYSIRAAYLKNIGRIRIDALEDHGIFTAFDIEPSKLENVPGFGTMLIRILLAWRRECEMKFKLRAAPQLSRQMDNSLQQLRDLRLQQEALHRHLQLAQLNFALSQANVKAIGAAGSQVLRSNFWWVSLWMLGKIGRPIQIASFTIHPAIVGVLAIIMVLIVRFLRRRIAAPMSIIVLTVAAAMATLGLWLIIIFIWLNGSL